MHDPKCIVSSKEHAVGNFVVEDLEIVIKSMFFDICWFGIIL